MTTSSEAYKRGYKMGLDWKNNYRPGGPYVGYRPYDQNPDRRARWEAAVKEKEDYLAGFDAAIDKKGLTIE